MKSYANGKKSVKSMIKRYVVSTLLMYVLLVVFFIILALFGVGDFLLLLAIVFMPSAISWLSSKIAKNKSQIKVEDKILSKIMVANILIYGFLNFAIVMLAVVTGEGLGFALGLSLVLIVPSIFISFRMFRVKKNTNTVEEGNIIHVNQNVQNIDLDEVAKVQGLMSSAQLGNLYTVRMIIIIGIVIGAIAILLRISDFFSNYTTLFVLIRLISPTIAVVMSCRSLKRVQIRKGDKLVRYITWNANLPLYFIVILFTNITSVFVWIGYALAFIPVYAISFFFFRKIERNAMEIKDVNGRVIDFNEIQFKDGITDDSFREFLIHLGIGSIDYFYGVSFIGEFGNRRIKQENYSIHYMIAFDEEQVYIFELYRRKISHLHIVPRKATNLIRWIDMENKRRLQLGGMFLEVRFDVKGLEQQEVMLNRFVAMFIE